MESLIINYLIVGFIVSIVFSGVQYWVGEGKTINNMEIFLGIFFYPAILYLIIKKILKNER